MTTAYLISGDDPFLAGEHLGKVVEAEGLAPGEVEYLEDAAEVLQSLRTPSMFGGRRAVVIRNIGALSADAIRQLVEYLEDPVEDAVLVMIGAKPQPRLVAAVKKVGKVVDAAKGRRDDLMEWLRAQAKAKDLKLAGEAMTALIEAIGEDRMALSQAIEELSLVGESGRLGPQDIREQFQGRAGIKVFSFVDAVASRQTGAALESLQRLVHQGEAVPSLFWAVAKHFRMLLIASGRSAPMVAESLGLPTWRAEKLVRQARSFTPEELVVAYRALADADHKMKKSEEPDALTLERAVVKISGR